MSRLYVNVDDFRRAARRRLPRIAFDAIDGGAGDEVTLRRNRAAFDDLALRPRALAPVARRDLSTTVLGEAVSLPVLLGPTGFARMAHRDAELAAARAAAAAGTVYALSTVASHEPEAVARAADGPQWFQLYPPGDREACAALIARVAAAGYRALVVTVDNAVGGLRERDRRHRLAVPLRITPRLVLHGATRPRWSLDYLRGGVGRGAQGMGALFYAERGTHHPTRSLAEAGRAMAGAARAITPEELHFIRESWDGPLLVKGILRGEECRMLLDLGVDGIVVSNHGGRQLDGVLATIEALPEVVRAVDGEAEVLLDGGIRRGTDVVKALALGARAVLVGRPYLFGLAAAGEAGVRGVIEVLRAEVDQTMALVGCSSVADIDPSAVHVRAAFAGAR